MRQPEWVQWYDNSKNYLFGGKGKNILRKKTILAISSVLLLALSGCSSSSTSAPVKQTKPKTQTTAQSINSASRGKGSDFKNGPEKVAVAGGLGDTYEFILTTFGKPSRELQKMKQGVGMYQFQNGTIEADFVQGRAYHVSYFFDSNPISLEQAKAYAKKLLPPDAKFLKEYNYNNQTFDVYQSKALIPLFDSDWFSNANGVVQPGYCDIGYLIENGKVKDVDSFTSDNP